MAEKGRVAASFHLFPCVSNQSQFAEFADHWNNPSILNRRLPLGAPHLSVSNFSVSAAVIFISAIFQPCFKLPLCNVQ